MVRAATIADLDWMIDLASRAHPADEMARVDHDAMLRWLAGLLWSSDTIAVRGVHGVAIGVVSATPWNADEKNCELVHLFSEPSSGSHMEPVALLREVDRIRTERGCRRFFIVSTGADLTAFAMKLGAKPLGSLHVMENAA